MASNAPDAAPQPRALLVIIGLLLLYMMAHVGLQLVSNISDQENTASIWYPVAGLSFAVISYYGAIGTIIVFCAICISQLLTGDPRIPFWAILPYGLAISGFTLMWRNIFIRTGIIGRQLTQTPQWAVGLMAMTVLVAASNTASGMILLTSCGIIPRRELLETSVSFFLGDLVGIMSIAPFLTLAVFPQLIPWQRSRSRSPWRWRQATLIYTVLAIIGYFLILKIDDSYKLLLTYLGAIPILLAAVRGRMRETCLAIFILTFSLAIGTGLSNTVHFKEITGFLLLIMAVAYVVTTAVSTNRAILHSLEATLAERDHLSAEQQKLGDQVARLRSMEALGTLAGGMAHELNNLLQPILTFARAAETAHDPERKTYLDRVRESTLAAKSLVQDVLTFARSGSVNDAPKLEQLQAKPLFQSSVEIARQAMPATVDIIQQHDLPDVVVSCVPPQLVQVLINLFRNAADARARTIHVHSCQNRQNQTVVLSVRDDGLGMDAETLKRALEPFFTTKQIGRGTGLGLSMVYGLVKSWGSDLHIDSIAGDGTNIRLIFPAHSGGGLHGNSITG